MSVIIKERKCSCRGKNPICQLCGGEGAYDVRGCARCQGTGKMAGNVKCLDCRGSGEALVVDNPLDEADDFVDFNP